MLVDLFSIPETTDLFYTNDIKVLIDILVRQLSDLSAGDPVRTFSNLLSSSIVIVSSHFSSANGIWSCAAEFYATPTMLTISIAHST